MSRLKEFLFPLAAAFAIGAGVAYIMTDEFGMVSASLAAAGLAVLIVGLVAYLDQVKALFRARSSRYAGGAATYLVLVLAAVVALNYIGHKRSWRKDLTESQTYSLTDKSRKVVQSLTRDVSIQAFFQDGTPDRSQAEDLLKEYERASRGKLVVEFVDPYRNPARAKEMGISADATLVMRSGAGQTKVDSASEEALTNALVKVTSDRQPVVYCVKGHGEKDPQDAEASGLSQLKKALEDENYVVKDLTLIQLESVPEDAALVIVAGPRLKYFPQERERLASYLSGGGRALLLLDPESGGWEDWLKDWGVEPRDEVVIDPLAKMLGADYTIPLVSQYGDHEITKNFQYATFFPTARPLRVQPTPPAGVTVARLAETTPQSWAESNLSHPRLDAGDEKGPLPVAVAITKKVGSSGSEPGEDVEALGDNPGNDKGREARLVVVGDSDFGSNTYVNLSANLNLLMNMISWLSRQEALISIREKSPGFRSISMTTQQLQALALITLLLIPGSLLAAGVYVWWHRRHL